MTSSDDTSRHDAERRVEYEDALKAQAEVYYRQVIASIDPSVRLTFVFAESE